MNYADSTAGVYPKPYDAVESPEGGITECAVIGQSFEFTLTIVVNDSLTYQGNTVALDSIVVNAVDSLPTGINYACVPANCHFKKNTIGCAKIFGIPTASNAPGDYNLKIKGGAYISGLLVEFPINFPDPGLAPGKYTIHLNANASDPCAATATNDLKGLVSVTTLPNPTAGITQIKINSKLTGQFQMRVVDLLGKRIEQRQVSIFAGENQLEFDASHLANGLYLFQLQNEKGFVTQKFAVQH
ncbi:MAG: T9SS type A sorting domain-containing protein [Saprospiraceae bacterium]|nr:T9SS type A sorting domain-containing protein [Saprospiraceae bacterium]MCF8250596.1 T9SS type A sorting domain-containing protein [Saprospiraceae bacterium]MCF8281412.1 T9SS type A sorting domain-containing protein [Bacteroidales bacterium]MCF8313085.1 T9SS type A sorting domain-containing protein [Saprospiraceae bacterium]MCF8441551.1 T9SS type A sorting domain-containing protein [Saprospiraceae bacterium]